MEGKIFQDRYRLIERIGSGGMADVYRAEDIVLSRIVALKVLYRSLAEDPDFVERFRREATSAGSLAHPNIVAIYDWGAEESTYYIVMEFVEGETLKDRVRREGALPQSEAVRLGKDVAGALAYAHKKEVVHRDIKPHNIILTPEGEVKVTDFGIARVGSTTITQAGLILGTAQYISPEQAKGEEIGPTSDIYSFGIVMYEMVTGKVPFDGDNPVSIALKQIEARPALPSVVNRDITVDLEKIIMKCLAKDPSLRYASAAECREDLERVEAGAPVFAPSPEITMVMPQLDLEKPRKKGRARKAIVTMLLALLLLGAAFGIGFAVYTFTRPLEQKISVPKVIGLTLDQAKLALSSRKLKVKKQGEEFSDTVPEGQIVKQTPADGLEASAQDAIAVVVSLGKPAITTPNVIGETSDNATSKMMKIGLEPSGNNAYEFSEKIAVGRVIFQTPEPGESVKKGSSFTLKISKGPEMVQVPDVYNKTTDEAKSALEQAGLKVSVNEEFNDSIVANTVIRTSPPAGTTVGKGSTVTVVVSKGPELISVPNVKEKTEAEAKTILQQAGLTPQTSPIPGGDPGKVFAQNPKAGDLVKRGTVITIYVGQ